LAFKFKINSHEKYFSRIITLLALIEQEDQPIPISPPLSKDKETGLMIFIEVLLADLLYLQEYGLMIFIEVLLADLLYLQEE
jgi:hypothetical protein